MSVTAVLGSQWGDEGKGKLVDNLLAEGKFKLTARFGGGHNAGHTLVVNGQKHDFHILPCGLLSPGTINLIGDGCVVHIPQFEKELASLKDKGIDTNGRIFISNRAHVLFTLHQLIDHLEEAELGDSKVGTTRSGIGPAYTSKMARSGVRMVDIKDKAAFDVRLRRQAESARKRYGDRLQYSVEKEIAEFDEYRARLSSVIVNTLPIVVKAQQRGDHILLEGANALLLDCNHGTYPYVTSSSTGLSGIFSGLGGIEPANLKEIIGVVKSYQTRVGMGPFPTEQLNDYGKQLQERGQEYGTTTGRRRRTGALDMCALRHAVTVDCYHTINLTKLDVLDDFDEILVGVSYIYPKSSANGHIATASANDNVSEIEEEEEETSFPANLEKLVAEGLQVKYKKFPGWKQDISQCRKWSDLPKRAQEYVEWIEKEIQGWKGKNIPIKYIGVGPGLVKDTKTAGQRFRKTSPEDVP
ncbi:MAG: hypothetical protein M1828_007599 [Chrysothrix sp. TS-e1954]|nr:MAG: hypothetical protein M1828_007599 [Chrysothrix sp. TS-e1954]